jgi:hypothetical protein
MSGRGHSQFMLGSLMKSCAFEAAGIEFIEVDGTG